MASSILDLLSSIKCSAHIHRWVVNLSSPIFGVLARAIITDQSRCLALAVSHFVKLGQMQPPTSDLGRLNVGAHLFRSHRRKVWRS